MLEQGSLNFDKILANINDEGAKLAFLSLINFYPIAKYVITYKVKLSLKRNHFQ